MFVKSLSLENFKYFKDKKFDFGKINVISGPNGSGKSSIFEALELLLINNLDQRMEHYVKKGGKKFKVEADIDLDITSAKYSIEYAGNTKRILRTSDDEYLQSDAVKYMSTVINPNLAVYSTISKQGESYSILKETPTNRLAKFKSIFSIDELSRISEIVKADIKSFKEQAKSLQQEVDILKVKTYSYFPEIELPDIESTKKELEIQEKEKKIHELNEKMIQSYELELKRYEDALKKRKEIQDQIEEDQKEIDRLEKEIVQYQDVTSQYEQLLKELSDLKAKKEEYDRKKDQFLKYRGKKESIESQIKSMVRPDTVNEPETLTLNKSIEDLVEDKAQLNSDIKSLESHLSLAESGKCHTCGQDYKAHPDDLKKQIEDARLKLSGIESEIKLTKSLLEQNDREKKAYQKYANDIERYESELSIYNKQLADLEVIDNPGRASFDFSDLESKIKSIEADVKSKQSIESRISEIKTKLDVRRESLNSFDLTEPEKPVIGESSFDEIVYSKLKNEIVVYEEKVKQSEQIKAHNQKVKEEESKDKQIIEQNELKITANASEIRVCEEVRKILEKDYPSFLIERTTEYVQKKMNEFFQRCYGEYEVYFRQNEKKDSLDFLYSVGSNEDDLLPAAMASGYERQLLSMSFRIALGSITHLGLYIFDEIDSDSSSENSIRLYRNFLEGERYDQVFLITHNPETLEFLVDNYNVNLIELSKNTI